MCANGSGVCGDKMAVNTVYEVGCVAILNSMPRQLWLSQGSYSMAIYKSSMN